MRTSLKVLLSVVPALALIYIGAMAFGARRWDHATQALVGRLAAARQPAQPEVVDFGTFEGLPPPVQRYFRAVLRDGQPLIASARVAHDGTFNLSATGNQWKPFTSRQWIRTGRPGFVWDGRISAAPGLPVLVHDAYVAGEGILSPAVLGLVSLMDLRGTPEIARGEFIRYIAEAPLVPTALLPGPGVTWAGIDDATADVTMVDGAMSATLRFGFTPEGLVDTVRAQDRGFLVSGKVIDTPWQGRWWQYEMRGGMRVPTRGEVAWLLPGGPRPYWRGRLTSAEYEFER